ncbi:MAG TPA: hypothetical protein VNG13_12790 [Mycobacteriales bacterium]|nr:hypothetical protein [Mycobacteriales bacterium]
MYPHVWEKVDGADENFEALLAVEPSAVGDHQIVGPNVDQAEPTAAPF